MASVLERNTPSLGSDDQERAALDFLVNRPGSDVRHSNATLIQHLQGVYGKLKAWQCRSALALAGLYHSVYGTESFHSQLFAADERDTVRAVIGVEAERLAHFFCMLNVRGFLVEIDADLATPERQLRHSGRMTAADKLDLLHLFLANWLEQLPRLRAIQRAQHLSLFRGIMPLLTPLARAEVEATFGFDQPPRPRRETSALTVAGGAETAVEVLDDFIPPHLQQRLAALTERNIWRYGWKASPTQDRHYFWHSHFAGDNEDGEASCEGELLERPLMEPVLALWHFIRDTIATGHVPVRVYANGHTYGGDGHQHKDSERAGHYTALYYAHPDWEANWGGETLFFDAAGRDVVKAVHPRPGRLVFFPGVIPHAARSPSRDCPALRAVIVVKTFCSPRA
ncbi:DUF6817 domain-containing protein [Sphingomonas sp.]|uniref:DUF6817 domain-containing protein n=1 Tax=Sphingomonas sp. TaxID=28214 RepID=UPI003433F8CB